MPPFSLTRRATQGFSLVELSVVVAIISVVAVLGLELAANFVNRSATTVSRERLTVVDDALGRFFKIYGRLPCPAGIALAPTATNYGLEDCTIAAVTTPNIGGGLLIGGVPFRTLNLPLMFSLDGFSNKLNYVVTNNLTMAGGDAGAAPTITKRFGTATTVPSNANDGIAGIEIRTGVLEQPCNTTRCQVLANPSTGAGAAYIAFSSGADQRGARSDRGLTRKACATATDMRVDTQNCVFGVAGTSSAMSVTTIPYNVFYDSRYNAGLNLRSYFDDAVVWRSKAQL